MKVFAELLRLIGVVMGLSAFGLVLAGALVAGIDPLWALVRAGVAAAVLLTAYAPCCRMLVTVFGIVESPADAGVGAKTAE